MCLATVAAYSLSFLGVSLNPSEKVLIGLLLLACATALTRELSIPQLKKVPKATSLIIRYFTEVSTKYFNFFFASE
jgi:hypothetical protein